MRVLALTPHGSPDAERIDTQARELARRCRTVGWTVDVARLDAAVAPAPPAPAGDESSTALRVSGGPSAGWIAGLRGLARRYDLLHVHDPRLAMVTANLIAQAPLRPAVLTLHEPLATLGRAQRACLRRYRWLMTPSAEDAMDLVSLHPRVVPCPAGVGGVEIGRAINLDAADPHRWAYWGPWSPEYRVDALIDLVGAARERGIGIDLLLANDGDASGREALEAQIGALQLDGSVRLMPSAERSEVLPALRDRAAFVTAAASEALAPRVLEAMMAGKIVLCRDGTPFDAWVRHGTTGFFLDFDLGEDDLQSVEAFCALGAADAAELSRAARRMVQPYDWDEVVRVVTRCYDEATGVGR